MNTQLNLPCDENMRIERSDLHFKGELEERPMKSFARWARNLLIEEKGGVLIIVAFLLFFVFLGMVAFSVDVGYLYLQRRHQQSTADAAALAAAWELPWYNASIEPTAKSYVASNNIDDAVVEVSPPDGDIRKVKVEITKEHPLFFAAAPPIRQTESDVYAMAVATRIIPGMDLLPLVMLEYSDFIPDEYRYHDYPTTTNEPVYKIDLPGNLHPHDNAYDFADEVTGAHHIWGDWGNDRNDFLDMLCDFVTCGDIDIGEVVQIYKQGNQAGNWGIVDPRPFSNFDGNQQGHPNHDAIQYVLKHGLDEPFCYDPNKDRKARPGVQNSIVEGNSDDGLKLSERLERDQDNGFYVILLLPGPAWEFQGASEHHFYVEDILIGYFKTLYETGSGNSPLEGLLTDVFICEDLDGSSWHSRVILIE